MGLKVGNTNVSFRNTHGNTHVSFRDPAFGFFPIKVCGLPQEVSNEDFGQFMGRFGVILKHYHFFKQAGGKRIKNDNRVFHFSKLNVVPPTSLLVQGRIVRIVYSKNIHQYFCSTELWRKITKDYLQKKDWSYDESSDEEETPTHSRPTKITINTTSDLRDVCDPTSSEL